MNQIPVTELLHHLDFDYQSRLGEFIRIGDLTAARNGIRGCFERGMLLSALANRFSVKKVLELGTGRGYVTACLSRFSIPPIEKIVTVDIKPVAQPLLWQLGISTDNVSFVEAECNALKTDYFQDKFDLIFIDAEHTGKAVTKNYLLAKSVANENAIFVFDDYRRKYQTVIEAIDAMEFVSKTLVYIDGWIIEHELTNRHKDETKNGKEIASGMVVACHSDFLGLK